MCFALDHGQETGLSLVAPHPKLQRKLQTQLASIRRGAAGSVISAMITARQKHPVGMDDGAIYPGDAFPLGTSALAVRRTALDRVPLSGSVRVIVVLVDFSDQVMTRTKAAFEKLFFSEGTLPTGSVRDYFREVSNNAIDIVGEVVGPYRMPKTLSYYANGESGTGNSEPNARTLAKAAVVAANPAVNFGLYDNNGDGYVDAFIVIHAGKGAEVTGKKGDIWSHKWVLPGGAYAADGKSIYAYLTVPEDCKAGVCCHELGHLLFGWPDLYDIDSSSEGVGNWCLMGGGSWNGNGDTPAHPSAWCKSTQGWITVVNVASNKLLTIDDVKTGFKAYRLWRSGDASQEYFLVENRQRTKFDAKIPGDGLVIYHIDEAIPDNSNEAHLKVAVLQADGLRQLESAKNRGDTGDPFPGSSNNKTFKRTSNPTSLSYGGIDTKVSVTSISTSGTRMTAKVTVK